MSSLYEFTASLPSAAGAANPSGPPIHSFAASGTCLVCGAPNGTCTGETHMPKTDEPKAADAKSDDGGDSALAAEAPTTDGGNVGLVDGPIGTHIGAIHHTPLNDAGQASLGVHNQTDLPDAAQAPGAVSISTEPVEGSEVLVRVTDDCFQEFYAQGAKRPSHRLIAAKGAILTKDQVTELQGG